MAAGKRTRVERGIWTRKTADGRVRFEAQFRTADGRMRRETADTLAEARAKLAVAVLDRRSGRLRQRPGATPTFADAASAMLLAEDGRLRDSTRAAYRNSLVHVVERFGMTSLDDIDVNAVASYVRDKEAEGLRGWTIRAHLTIVRKVFAHASRRMGWKGTNPVGLLTRHERPRADAKDKRVLTTEELVAILAAAPEPGRTAIALAAATGVRVGELLAVTWQRVDLDEGLLHITHQRTRPQRVDGVLHPGTLAPLKTAHSRRVLPLPLDVTEMLKRHMVDVHQIGYVFHEDGEPWDHDRFRRALRNAVKAAGIIEDDEHPKVAAHTLRRSWASRMIASGSDLTEVSRQLGHSNVAVTASAYVLEFDVQARATARRTRLEVAFQGVFGGGQKGAEDVDGVPEGDAKPDEHGANGVTPYSLSRRVPSATRPPLPGDPGV